jgi:DNA-3-methyladenine glycosylase II
MAISRVVLTLPRPINFASSLAPLGRSGDDLLDRFDGRLLVRSLRHADDAEAVAFAAEVPQEPSAHLDVTLAAGPATHRMVDAIASTFVVDDAALEALAREDAAISRLSTRYPGHRPVLFPDPFHALVRSISAQQVNLRWAATIRARLALRYGQRLVVGDAFVQVLDAGALARATIDELRGLQLTGAKARSVIAVARAARDGELRLQELGALDDKALTAHLTRLPGIGRWSAEWFLARTLGRPCVVAGDLGVRKAVGRLYDEGLPSETEVRRLTEHWGPAATLAQALALHDLAVRPSLPPAR